MGTRLALNLYLVKRSKSAAEVAPTLAGLEEDLAGELSDAVHASSPSASGGDEAGVSSQPKLEGWAKTWLVSREGLVEGPLPAERAGQAALAVRATVSSPGWLTVLNAMSGENISSDAQMAFGALFFQEIGDDLVVWSFGTGWMLIDASCTVARFGLSAGLNALLSRPAPGGTAVGIRQLTSAVRAPTTRKATVTTARPASPLAMERVDRTSDGAQMAALVTGHPTFDRIEAGRSLRFDAEVRFVSDLTRYAVQALRLYRRNDFRSSDAYRWIEHTVPVEDDSEVTNVLDELWRQATSPKAVMPDAIWADSDPATGAYPKTLRFRGERQADERTTLTWALAHAWIVRNTPLSGAEALKTELRFFVDPAAAPTVRAPLWHHLVAQLDLNGQTYLVSDAEIWRANPVYLEELNADIEAHTSVNPPTLPRYIPGEVEDSYNRRAASHGNHLLIDKALLRLPGHTAVEAGDLLSSKGELMHVKRRSGSSAMSHAAAQALGATHLLRSNSGARTLLDDIIKSARPAPPGRKAMRGHVQSFGGRVTATVQIVIVGDWRGTPRVAQLPLLTRLNLSAWIREMPCDRRIVLVGT
jgi:uncharacterized protein (TIGR04141 family)